MKKIYLAGGCFWGLEKYISMIPGVVTTKVGYANGNTANPTYEHVCDNSGHAETVEAVYNPEKIALSALLELFYDAIDPTSLNKQGNDEGVQYRTGVYYTDEADKEVIEESLDALGERIKKPVAVEALKLDNFYPAEEYHQKYLEKKPCEYCHIKPETFDKLKKIK